MRRRLVRFPWPGRWPGQGVGVAGWWALASEREVAGREFEHLLAIERLPVEPALVEGDRAADRGGERWRRAAAQPLALVAVVVHDAVLGVPGAVWDPTARGRVLVCASRAPLPSCGTWGEGRGSRRPRAALRASRAPLPPLGAWEGGRGSGRPRAASPRVWDGGQGGAAAQAPPRLPCPRRSPGRALRGLCCSSPLPPLGAWGGGEEADPPASVSDHQGKVGSDGGRSVVCARGGAPSVAPAAWSCAAPPEAGPTRCAVGSSGSPGQGGGQARG